MTDTADRKATDLDALIEQCRSGDHRSKIRAMMALEAAGARQAVDVILPLLTSGDDGVRSCAAETLGTLGDGRIHQVGPALESLLADPVWIVRNEAIESLGVLRYVPARPAIEERLHHDDEWVVRASAAEALGELGDAGALPALAIALDDALYPVRSYAAFSIGQLGDAAQLPVIRRRLAVEIHPMPRAELVAVALRFGDEPAFDDLLVLARVTHDRDSANDVFRVVKELLSARTPPVVVRRAIELGDELEALGRRSDSDEDYVAELRARLAALAQPLAPNH